MTMAIQGGTFEQVFEQSQRTHQELQQAISQAATVLVRYAQQVRPMHNPSEVLLAANQQLYDCATAIIERIDAQSGRLRPTSPRQNIEAQQAQEQARVLEQALWRVTGGGGGQSPRGRKSNRQRQRELSLQR